MTRARFDVFLDRFQLDPGQDFIERIEDEIVDKSMVVVVETAHAARSRWVQHEVAVALKRGIGVAAVNVDWSAETPGIDEAFRFRDGDDDALRAFLLEQHSRQLWARREWLRESVWQALRDAGASPADIDQTALGFDVRVGGRRRVIGVCVRPADVHRFRLLHEQADADTAFLVHPVPTLHHRRLDSGWLSDRSGIVEVDEGRLGEAAETMASP